MRRSLRGQLPEDPEAHQMLCRGVQGGYREIEGSFGLPNRANRVGLEMSAQFPCGMGSPANSSNTIPIRLKEIVEPRGRLKCLLSRHGNSLEKEHGPGFPVTIFPDLVEKIVVKIPVRFEEQAQVKQRLPERPFRAKQQGNQEMSDATIPAKERVNMDGRAKLQLYFRATGTQPVAQQRDSESVIKKLKKCANNILLCAYTPL